jgi:hypothetical protein
MAEPSVAVQWADACPSPSWSFADTTQVPCTVSHSALAQPGGIVIGSFAAQSAFDVHAAPLAVSPPASWLPFPPLEPLPLLHEPPPSARATALARATDRERRRTILIRPLTSASAS